MRDLTKTSWEGNPQIFNLSFRCRTLQDKSCCQYTQLSKPSIADLLKDWQFQAWTWILASSQVTLSKGKFKTSKIPMEWERGHRWTGNSQARTIGIQVKLQESFLVSQQGQKPNNISFKDAHQNPTLDLKKRSNLIPIWTCKWMFKIHSWLWVSNLKLKLLSLQQLRPRPADCSSLEIMTLIKKGESSISSSEITSTKNFWDDKKWRRRWNSLVQGRSKRGWIVQGNTLNRLKLLLKCCPMEGLYLSSRG